MSIEEVRRDLPPVKVQVGDQVLDGILSGRLLDYAIVTVRIPFGGILVDASREFCWITVAKCVSDHTPLLFG